MLIFFIWIYINQSVFYYEKEICIFILIKNNKRFEEVVTGAEIQF